MNVLKLSIVLLISLCFACGGAKGPIANDPAAQDSGLSKAETRASLTGFKKIKAENAVKLDITVQKEFSVAVQADDTVRGNVTTEVKDDTLVISVKDQMSPRMRINITISMPELIGLDLTGAATAVVSGIKGSEFQLNAVGASKAKLNGEVKSLTIKAVGASNINAENLKSQTATAESIGASSIVVSASEKLTADATGASSVIYTGDPKELKQNAVDVSTIKKK